MRTIPVAVLLAAIPALAQTTLEPGKPVTKTIRVGEVDRYIIEAPPGAFVRGAVVQEGVAVNVRGFFPDGSKIRAFANPRAASKIFRFAIEIPGPYQLEVTGFPGGAPDGRYTITVDQIQLLADRLTIPLPERYASPRIQALEKDIEIGRAHV